MNRILTVGLADILIKELEDEFPYFNISNLKSTSDCFLPSSDIAKIQLLIASSQIDKVELGELSSSLNGTHKTVPLLVLRGDGRPIALTNLVRNMLPVSQSNTLEPKKEERETDYYAVPLIHFHNLEQIFCDIYIRIRKSGTKDQFVKRISAHDKIDIGLIERLANYGVDYLYVPLEFKTNFNILFMNKTMTTLNSKESKELYKISTNAAFQQAIFENILKDQFGAFVVEMAKSSIKAMYEALRSHPSLSEIESLLEQSSCPLNNRLNYISTIVIHKILQKIIWSTSEHKIKLTYSCFFSDIFNDEALFKNAHFPNTREHNTINTPQFLKDDSHALKNSELIKKFTELPLGIETIIREHHGDKRGIMLKSEPDIDISPLSRILLLSNDFALQYLEGAEKGQPLKIVRTLSRKYKSSEIQKLILILEETVLR